MSNNLNLTFLLHYHPPNPAGPLGQSPNPVGLFDMNPLLGLPSIVLRLDPRS